MLFFDWYNLMKQIFVSALRKFTHQLHTSQTPQNILSNALKVIQSCDPFQKVSLTTSLFTQYTENQNLEPPNTNIPNSFSNPGR